MSKELGKKTKRSDALGERLKRFRQQKRLSLKEMASAVGVPVTTYREWEYGRAIKGEPYTRIAEVLGISLVELLTGKRPSKASVEKELDALEQHLATLRKELGSFFENEQRT